jgi:hypothetical protein
MFLYTLNKTTYVAEDLIEGYSSLIWTERYRDAGEVELKTPLIKETMAAIPLGTLLGLQETDQIMIVESHGISKDSDGKTLLTVSGRSFETIMEARVALNILNPLKNPATGDPYTWEITARAGDVAESIIKKVLVAPSAIDSKDAIPNLTVWSIVTKTQPVSTYIIQRGTLYERVMELLDEQDLGIQSTRSNFPYTIGMKISIVEGEDKSSSVVFYEENGDFTVTNYLSSIKDYRNAAYASGPLSAIKTTKAGASSLSGVDRRVAILDYPDVVSSTRAIETSALTSRAAAHYAKKNSFVLLDADVSPNNKYVYRSYEDYYIGDLVTCIADYGINQKMRVNEYIRIEDEDGERGYPTLVIPEYFA